MARIVVAAALLWFVFFQADKGTVPVAPDVKPRPAMYDDVMPVVKILDKADIMDRMIFASVWENCADAVEDNLEDVTITFENTLALKLFTESALRVAWGRIADASGKYPGLNNEVESLFSELLGNEIRPVTDEILEDYADLCHALAWAGMPGEN